jgi:hypothetical protein
LEEEMVVEPRYYAGNYMAMLLNFTKNFGGLYGDCAELRLGHIPNKIVGVLLYATLLGNISR